jgi:hypothetical protein
VTLKPGTNNEHFYHSALLIIINVISMISTVISDEIGPRGNASCLYRGSGLLKYCQDAEYSD